MTLSQAFSLSIYYVSLFWIVMIVLPNRNFTKKVMGSFIPFVPLCLMYIYYLLTTSDSGSLTGAFNPQLAQYTNLFSKEGGTLTVTIHFLTMDLLVGRWIYWQGQEKNIWTAHSLTLCLFFGPAGLLSHIITAYIFDKKNNAEEGETDTAVS